MRVHREKRQLNPPRFELDDKLQIICGWITNLATNLDTRCLPEIATISCEQCQSGRLPGLTCRFWL